MQRDYGRYAEAMASFTRVLELQPTRWVAHVQCAVCATLLGKPPGGKERALADLQAAAVKVRVRVPEVEKLYTPVVRGL